VLSQGLQRLTYVVALLFGVLGAVLFVAPNWAAQNFPWEISPFVAMTMGGWYFGSAVMTFVAARVWQWPLVYGLLIYAWSFGVLEGALLIVHRDVLVLSQPLAVPYIAVLAVASLAALLGVVDRRPAMVTPGLPQPWWIRAGQGLFVVYVLLLVYLLSDGIAPDGRIWPGPLSLLTARCFGAFFFSLAFAEAWLFFARGMAPIETYMRPALFLAAIIEVAAVVFIGRFDFASRPGGLLYHGSYIAAIIGAGIIVLYCRKTRAGTASPAAAGGVPPPSSP
jgi:hypothetical protein